MKLSEICEVVDSYGFTIVDAIDPVDDLRIPVLPASEVVKLIREVRARTLESEAAMIRGFRGRIMNERAALIREGRI